MYLQVSRGPLGLPPRFGRSLLLSRSAMAKRKSVAKNITQWQMHSSQGRIRMKLSSIFCDTSVPPLRGDITFVLQTVRTAHDLDLKFD